MTCWGVSVGPGGLASPEDVYATPGEFVSVSVGWSFACGVRVGGRMSCWSDEDDSLPRELRSSPEGRFTAVSVGLDHVCGVREEATVACWGEAYFGADRPPAGEFVSVSAGDFFSCGVRTDGEVVCWGLAQQATCGGGVSCWGWNRYPGAAPEGPFTAVSVTPHRYSPATICGLRGGGELVCWNDEAFTRRPPVGSFATLDGGRGGVCGVRSGGGVVCWGEGASGWAPPAGVYVSVSVGAAHGCGVLVAGEVACWGEDSAGQATAPGGVFTSVSAGEDLTCGVGAGGEVACWGSNRWWGASPPVGTFAAVGTGAGFACGLRPGGEAVCWGDDRGGRASPPPGRFAALSVAGGYACGLRPGGQVVCWGDRHSPPPLPGSFAAISAHDGSVCGLRPGGSVDCWYLLERAWWHHGPEGVFVAVSAAAGHACGVRPDGSLECWSPRWPPGMGAPRANAPVAVSSGDGATVAGVRGRGVPGGLSWVLGDLPAGPFVALDAGWDDVCGVRADGSVACWGGAGSGRVCQVGAAGEVSCGELAVVEHEGVFEEVTVGFGYGCGLRPSGEAACWQASDGDPPPGPFEALDAGWRKACGLRAGGAEVVCWGFGQLAHQGEFTKISAGYGGGTVGALDVDVCALRVDGDAECPDRSEVDFFAPPPPWIPGGPYRDIAVGRLHACAVRAGDGGVLCWGDNRWGQTDTPEGTYTAIDAGQWHTCALHTSGDVTCWGDGPYRDRYADPPEQIPTAAPPGPYTAITAGAWHTCALRTDGTPQCWLSY